MNSGYFNNLQFWGERNNTDCKHNYPKIINTDNNMDICPYCYMNCRMPYRFTTGDIKSIAKRLGLQKINSKKWNGVDINGEFIQTYIHEHGDDVQILSGTAKRQAVQMGFKDIDDMYDFLKNNKRKR